VSTFATAWVFFEKKVLRVDYFDLLIAATFPKSPSLLNKSLISLALFPHEFYIAFCKISLPTPFYFQKNYFIIY